MTGAPAGRMPYADQCPRAYTRTGRTAHLLLPFASLNDHGTALCGVGPEYFDAWRGSGSQEESETLASLPLCRRCEKLARAADGKYAKFGPQGCAPVSSDPLAGHAPEAGQHAPAISPPAGAGPRRHLPPNGVAVRRSSPLLSERQAAETVPGPETRRPGPAAVRAGAPAPVAAVPDGAPASGPAAAAGRPEPGRSGTSGSLRPGQGDGPEFPPLREVTQTILYSPAAEAAGVPGNCLQAAIASALGLDLAAVPHFGTFTWWEAAARLWLRGRQLDWRWVPIGRGLPEGRCIIVGLSPRGTGRHALAGDGGRIAWDPHPSRDGLTEIQGAYEFRRWPGGAPEDEACVACSAQLAPVARPRERPSGTCSGCGETRALRQDGTVQLHRLWTPQSSGTCGGSHKPPSLRPGSQPGDQQDPS